MLKKTITYEDFNGNMQTGDFYFNLTKAELIKMKFGFENLGFEEVMNKIIESKNAKDIIDHFESIILLSYGERSEDGQRFVKSEKISEDFKHTAAYPEIFMSLFESENGPSDFVTSLVPASLVAQIKADEEAKRADGRPALQDHLPKKVVEKPVEAPTETLQELRVVNEAAPIEIPKLADEDLEYQEYRRAKRLENHARLENPEV